MALTDPQHKPCHTFKTVNVFRVSLGWSGAFILIMTYETESVFSETATHAEQNAF